LTSIGGATAAFSKRPTFRRFALMLFDKLKREWKQGEDRRQPAFYIPAAHRLATGVLDFGFCVIDLKRV
jgi:hypothetical protein